MQHCEASGKEKERESERVRETVMQIAGAFHTRNERIAFNEVRIETKLKSNLQLEYEYGFEFGYRWQTIDQWIDGSMVRWVADVAFKISNSNTILEEIF